MVDEGLPRPEYPRPQFRRERWINLNGEWRFAFDDEDMGLADGWHDMAHEDFHSGGSPLDRNIVVPFCFQSELSSIGETALHDVVWYARTFEYVPADDERLLLHFGAVDYRAKVWVNGTQVASHEGGHTPFSADVTDALIGDTGENVVVVRAEDPSRDRTIPRGKQYWKEESEDIFYTRTTGIWQTVWLEPVNRLRSEGLPLVGYTWWPLFSLVDWAYREGEKPPEAYLWHMGMYDLESDGSGGFIRTETPVEGAFRTATGRTSKR